MRNMKPKKKELRKEQYVIEIKKQKIMKSENTAIWENSYVYVEWQYIDKKNRLGPVQSETSDFWAFLL